jgi:hypothetical protein
VKLDPIAVGHSIRIFVASNASYAILDAKDGGTWSAGGCGILAFAVYRILGKRKAKIIAIAKDGCLQHLGVAIDGRVLDANGVTKDPNRWLANFERDEDISDCVLYYMNIGRIGLPTKHDRALLATSGIPWSQGVEETEHAVRTILSYTDGASRIRLRTQNHEPISS